MKRLDKEQIQDRLTTLDGWKLDGDALVKIFTFDTFPEAMAFVNRVAVQAEAADHHPDFRIEFSKVTLTLSTHSAGGITGRDFDLAAAIG